jgi:exosome complex component RRP40
MKVILPGEKIDIQTEKGVICLGPGLSQSESDIYAHRGGLLRSQPESNRWWIEGNKKRYVPAVGEPVIGQIVSRHVEEYKVDIGSAHMAILPVLAFEGATKKNRPDLKVGALVYARVSFADKDMEPEIECFNSTTERSEGYGELKDGFLITCSLGHCLRLLRPNAAILRALGQHIPFELAIGVNGRIWLRADSIDHTIIVANAILRSEGIYRHLSTDESDQWQKQEFEACRRLVRQLLQQ